MPKVTRDLTVTNAEGLHMRPMMKFVDAANRFAATVTVTKPHSGSDETVDGKSVMGMMTFVDVQGTTYRVDIDGDDADEAAAVIEKLFEEKFGEE